MFSTRLFWRIFPYYLAIALASLAVLTWYDCSAVKSFFEKCTGEDLEARAILLRSQFSADLASGKFDRIDAQCKELGHQASMRITVILAEGDRKGQVVGDSEESPQSMDNHADRPEIIDAFAGKIGRIPRFSNTFQETWLYVAVPVEFDKKIVGVLRTSVSMHSIEEALDVVIFRIIMLFGIMAVLVAGISLWNSHRIVRPLMVLKNGAERFARGDLSGKLSAGEIREFAALADSLNQMAASLDEKIRDITNEGNERAAIFASMVEGVLAVDSEEKILRINEAAATSLGIDANKAPGRPLQEVVRLHSLHKLFSEVLSTHQSRKEEIVLPTERGDRYLIAQGTMLRNDRETIGALVILHDVTRLKRLEKVRRDFVANVSHELRTPVTSIKGFVETLLDGAMQNPEECERFLRIVASQTERLSAIIEDLLTLSRIEQEEGNAEIPLEPSSVQLMLETALEVCHMKATEKNIRIEVTCPADLQAVMNAPLLEQAVINLLDNAVKYSEPGQTIAVSVEETEREILLRVRDSGCGIAREHLPRIFERFYRVDKARSRKLGGTGLGLAIVKHIAQAHGGRATVESTLGQGSTFTIHLPTISSERKPT